MSTARTKRPTESQPDWPQHLARWQQSGLSQAAYCQTHDLVYHRFNVSAPESTSINSPPTSP